ncbi:MFS transporter [Clavibacter capsici]|uniref:MFS transporter n=1 Tax=Clavibacter capsici TaxID=1874630 RepID=UPI00142870FE|nr:MFS transporter [Clavibacter capsici]QIS38036.1 MFS transporter [Clavibacter capsici]
MGRSRTTSSLALVVTCFLAGMALSTAPTPLYPAYEARFAIGPSGVTLLFAGFAVGAIASLLASLRVLRGIDLRAVVALAAGIEAVAAVALALLPSFAGFALGRLLTGVGVGVLASSISVIIGRIAEAGPPSRASTAALRIAPALSMCGLALGPLVSGLAAPTDPDRLRALYLAYAAVLALGAVAARVVIPPLPAPSAPPAGSAEAARPARPAGWTLLGAFLAFSVTGLFGALAPTLLAAMSGDVPVPVSGLVVASVFLAGAVAPQVVRGRAAGIAAGTATLVAGLVLVAAATTAGAIGLFVTAGALSGAGAGIVFSAALRSALRSADAATRPRASTLVFTAAYAGLAVPVVGVGLLLTAAAPAAAAWLFAAAIAVGAVALRRAAPRGA